MRYFDAFAGIGGFSLGIHNAAKASGLTNRKDATSAVSAHGSDDSSRDGGQSPTCVGYSEIDKYAIKVYERNFPNARNYGDITKINADELPDFDCLVGGFPCQAFSIAGKRRGFEDTRGTLFFDLARILRAKRPRLFVFENVKGLLSHDNGNTFKTIIATIDELGYDCQWQVLNSKNHGVPQNRERIYIVGHLRGTPRPQVFPIDGQSNENTTLGKSTETAVARTLTAGGHSGGNHSGMTIVQLNEPTHSNDRVYASDGISPTLNTMQGGNRQPFIAEDVKIRRLTPKECERLQGFPDNWTAEGIDGPISDTQRYKMCGNAVTTNVVQAVFERILGTEVYIKPKEATK